MTILRDNVTNGTGGRDAWSTNSEEYIILYAVLCSVISLATVIGNVLLFFTVLKTSQLRTPTNSLLLSLATADLIAGAVMIPLYVQQFIKNSTQSSSEDQKLCLVRKFLFLLTSGASITSLAVVSVDRMFAVSYPFIYARRMNAKIVAVIIATVWTVCVTLTSNAVFGMITEWKDIMKNCGPGIPRSSYFIVTPTLFYVPGVMILLSYLKIYSIARKHRRKITAQHEPSVQPPPVSEVEVSKIDQETMTNAWARTSTLTTTKLSVTSRSTSRQRRITRIRTTLSNDLKAAKTVSILVGLFLICWSPVAIFYIYLNSAKIDITSRAKYTYIHDVFMFLSFLNAAIDPILYTLLNRDMKSSMKRHLKTLFKLDR